MNKSRKVSEEAERFEAIMRFNIFREEQELQLWGYREDTDWVPGVPMYDRPSSRAGQQYIRRMIESLDIAPPWHLTSEFSIDNHCVVCDVAWNGREPCFVCGIHPEKQTRGYTPSATILDETSHWVNDYDVALERIINARPSQFLLQFPTYSHAAPNSSRRVGSVE